MVVANVSNQVRVGQWTQLLGFALSGAELPLGFDPESFQQMVSSKENRDLICRDLSVLFQKWYRKATALMVKLLSFDPVTFGGLGQGWGLSAADHDPRNDGLSEIDWNEVSLTHDLQVGESIVLGEEKLARQKRGEHIRYGASLFFGLWQDYQERGDQSVLERLAKRGVTFISFFGDILIGPDGQRCALFLCRCDGRWCWYAGRLDDHWDGGSVSAVSQD